MNNKTVRQLSLTALCVALTITVNLVFYPAFFLVFVLIILLLPKQNALLYAFVVALINFIGGVNWLTFINVILLPLTAWLLLMIANKARNHEIFALGNVLVQSISNSFYALLSAYFFTTETTWFSVFWPLALDGVIRAILNAFLFYLLGHRLLARLKPLLLRADKKML